MVGGGLAGSKRKPEALTRPDSVSLKLTPTARGPFHQRAQGTGGGRCVPWGPGAGQAVVQSGGGGEELGPRRGGRQEVLGRPQAAGSAPPRSARALP